MAGHRPTKAIGLDKRVAGIGKGRNGKGFAGR